MGLVDGKESQQSDAPAPVAWISDVTLEGATESVRVTLLRREGHRVILRQIDPCDPEPERVPIYEGDQIEVAQAISHVSLHTNDVVGDATGFLFGVRVVEARREPGKVMMRTLRDSETDTGARVHIAPGDDVVMEAGSLVAELDHIDKMEQPTASGYVELSPAMSAWFQFGPHNLDSVRYLLAAARRLYEANRRMIEIEECRTALAVSGIAGPEIRKQSYRLIGAVESAIIALWRAVDMVTKSGTLIGATHPIPAAITNASATINVIRRAYEHIEDRAVGTVFGKPDPEALTIFDYAQLVKNDTIVYGNSSLSLTADVPNVIEAAREFLKKVAGDS